MNTFLQGILLGFAYVAPIGMQNVFVIQSALTTDQRQAFLTAFFVIINDVLLAFACFWGVGALLEHYSFLRIPIALVGCLFILFVAYSLWHKSANDMQITRNVVRRPWQLFMACFAVTWLNPQAIIDGTLLFGGMRASLSADIRINFIMGVALASLVWFSTISFVVFKSSHSFTPKVQLIINRICAIILLIFAVKLGLGVF